MNVLSMSLAGSLVVIGGGLLVFRRQAGRFYDGLALTEEERKHYKERVLPMLGVLLLVGGVVIGGVEGFVSRDPERARELAEAAMPRAKVWIGGAMVLLGLGGAILHLFAPEKLFKLRYMQRTYGTRRGRLVHLLGYAVLPIVAGLRMLLDGI